jgi:hypothetical protein
MTTAAPPRARGSAWLWQPGLRYHCLAAAPFLVVFAMIPFGI